MPGQIIVECPHCGYEFEEVDQHLSVEIGGRDVVAFVTVEDDELVAIHPIPVDASQGFTFSGRVSPSKTVDVHGVQNAIGQRIAQKYESGALPASEVAWEDVFDE